MKKKFDFISFEDSLIQLNQADYLYWRTFLPKIIRAACEFEFNLTDAFTCLSSPEHRDFQTCLCLKDCKESQTCIHTNCQIYQTAECNQMFCPMFTSGCVNCKDNDTADCSACKTKNPYRIQRDRSSRDTVASLLNPARSVRFPLGVHQVTSDGSLVGESGGIEVTTVAQRINYDRMEALYTHIMDVIKQQNGWTNERCSIHCHVLTGYVPEGSQATSKSPVNNFAYSDLEKPVPEIIVVNWHQLIRRYENALLWMFSAGPSLSNLTRWSKFRQSIAHLKSPTLVGMRTLQNDVARNSDHESGASGGRGKYGVLNYYYTQFNEWGDASPLHVEFRFSDGHWVPSVAAVLPCLLYALLLKAVDLSQYGMLLAFSEDEFQRKQYILSHLMNNNGDFSRRNRLSNTSGIEEFIPEIVDQAKEMLRLIRPILKDLGPVHGILDKLTDTPISILRSKGFSWDEINTYYQPVETVKPKSSKTQREVSKLIDLGSWESDSEEDWIKEVSAYLNVPDTHVLDIVSNLVADKTIHWSQEAGSFCLRKEFVCAV